MSGRSAELREAVRRLREAAETGAGRLGAATEVDREILRRVTRNVLREVLPDELAGLERSGAPEADVRSRLAGLERRLEHLEARLGPRPDEGRRPPAAKSAMFPPAAPEAGRRPSRAAKVAASVLAVLLVLGLGWLLAEPVTVWLDGGDPGQVREAATRRLADAWGRIGYLAGRRD